MRTSVHDLPVGLPLRVNFSWTFAGNVVYAASQWGTLIVLARLGSAEMLGEFALALAVTGPFYMLAGLRLWHVEATDVGAEYRFGDYLGLIIVTAVAAQVLIASLVLFPGFRGETGLVIFIVGAAKAFEAVSEVHYGLLMQRERLDRIAKSMMMKGPVSLAALGAAVYMTGSIVWGVVGMAVVWALTLLLYDTRSARLVMRCPPAGIYPLKVARDRDGATHPRWEKKILMELAWLALPLGIITLLISLNVNIPRYFVDGDLGKRALGIFAALAYTQLAGPMVIQAMGRSASARLSHYYASGSSGAFRTLLFKLVAVSALLGAAGVLAALIAGRQILTLVYGPEYALWGLLVVLMAAAGIDCVGSTLHFGMIAARYFRIQLPLFLSVTGVVALGCLWLVPFYGLTGAATAILLASVVRAVGSLGIVFHAYRAIQLR